MSTAIQWLSKPADILAKGYDSTTLEEKSLQSVFPSHLFLCSHQIATSDTDGIQLRCVRFLLAVTWRSSTTRSLQHSFLNQWIKALRPSINWRGVAPSAWVLSRVGVRNIVGKLSPPHHAGLSCTSMGRCNGWTASWPRWDRPPSDAHPCPKQSPNLWSLKKKPIFYRQWQSDWNTIYWWSQIVREIINLSW